MVNPTLQATVEAMSEDELVEFIEFIEQSLMGERPAVTEEQKAVVRSRRPDADPANWRTPEETAAHLRELRA